MTEHDARLEVAALQRKVALLQSALDTYRRAETIRANPTTPLAVLLGA